MATDKLAAPYKKLFTKVKQLRERLEKVMSTDHIDLTELSKVRENLEFFEKKLQENRERKLQKKLELEKELAKTVSDPKIETSQPEVTNPTEQPTDVQPETVNDAQTQTIDVTPDANSTPETVPVEAATEKEADTTVFAFNSMVEPSRGLPGSWGKVIHHDAANNEVYVEWQDGKLKDRDGFGAYSVSDLKVRASKKKAAMVRYPDYELRKGTKFVLARSVMTKSGVILETGTKGEITDIIGDHIHFKANGQDFILNKFDALKLNKTASKKLARKIHGKRKKKAQEEVEEIDVRDSAEFQQAMAQLAEKTGLEYDGGADSRLFLQDEQISTYAPALGEEGYAKMEEEMAAYSDRGAGFEVHVWNDSSGFDYWNKEDEMNYIQVTVDVSPEALMNNEINPEEVRDKAYTAHAVFEKYEGTGDYTENLRRREQSMESELIHSDTCDTCGTKQRYPGQCEMCRKNKELGTYRKKQTMQLSDADKQAYLNPDQEAAIKSILSNDEESDDEELVAHFVNTIGVSENEARNWVSQRGKYLKNLTSMKLSQFDKTADVYSDKFLRQYLETALWSSHDESDETGGEPLDVSYDIDNIAGDGLERSKQDIEEFKAKAGALLEGLDETQVAHDFWLTRNHHGAGFWDADYVSEEVGKQLTDIAESFGEVYLMVGDNDQLYLEGSKKVGRGERGALYNYETAQGVVDRLNQEIEAPFVSAYSSDLGGKENISILMTVSLDPKESWENQLLPMLLRFCSLNLH